MASFAAIGTVGSAESAAGVTTLDIARTVTAGSLLVAYAKHEQTAATLSCAYSTGTPTFTAATKTTNGSTHGQFFYLLSSTGGAVTIRLTLSASRSFASLQLGEYSYTGAASFDTEQGGSGSSFTALTANMTTTGTDELVVAGYSENSSGNTSAYLINGGSPDRSGQLATVRSAYWDKVFSSTFTGASQCSLAVSDVWVVRQIAFSATAGGGATRGDTFDSGVAFDGGRTFGGILRRSKTIFLPPRRKLVIARQLPKAA